MYVCVYIYMYVCVYIYVCMCVYICVYVCVYIYIYMYVCMYIQPLKKNKIMPFAETWIQAEILKPSEVSQTKKEKYHKRSLICRI